MKRYEIFSYRESIMRLLANGKKVLLLLLIIFSFLSNDQIFSFQCIITMKRSMDEHIQDIIILMKILKKDDKIPLF